MYLDLSSETIKSVCEIALTAIAGIVGWAIKIAVKKLTNIDSNIAEMKTQVMIMAQSHEDLKARVTKLEDVVYER